MRNEMDKRRQRFQDGLENDNGPKEISNKWAD